MKKCLIVILLIVNACVIYSLFTKSESLIDDKQIKVNTTHLGSLYDLSSDESSYETYLKKYPQVFPKQEVTFNFLNINDVTYTSEYEEQIEIKEYKDTNSDVKKDGLYVPEEGNISFNIEVQESGYYNIKLDYYNVSGRGGSIERNIKINDELPFSEAAQFKLTRYWTDEFDVSEKRKEGQHDFKPSQIEINRWSSYNINNFEGLYTGAYKFYFEKGTNKISFDSLKEPIVLNNLTLLQLDECGTYDNYVKEKINEGATVIDKEVSIKQQGETTLYKSSSTLTPQADYSSSKTEPYEMNYTRYNNIGGTTWRLAGDFITWEVDVEETGLYKLSFKVLQNITRGMSTNRELLINGEVPFEEVYNISIPYNSNWQNFTVADEEENPYLIYFEKGSNTITLKNTVGVYQEIIRETEQVVSDLRALYREVVMRTGLSPEEYQDYRLEEYIDRLFPRINEAKSSLEKSRLEIIEIAGERTTLISIYDTLIFQLEKFSKSEKNLQNDLTTFESNISTLGTFVLSISEQSLNIDYLLVSNLESDLPKASTNIFEKMIHEFKLFVSSFITTSNSLDGNYKVDGPTITVWTSTGRDQAMVVRQLIDQTFTNQYNINVELKLVSAGVLLPATVSGNGPDVAIGIGEGTPVNWGIRNAITDLTQFPDFEDFSTNFHPSAITPYTFRDKIYALPDTQDFYVTFYRTDIINELKLESPPKTWNEMVTLLPLLQKNYMEYYIPNSQASLSPALYSMINQYGGSLYKNDGEESNLMDKKSTEAFVDFTRYFSDYGMSLNLNFLNRFRSGEAPFGIATFNGMYNQLSVFAPEISNDWDFTSIPGVIDENGELNNTTTSITSSSIILEASKEKQASWEFLKWWLGEETQLTYARNMEAILGSAARYPTANLKAFDQLSWTNKQFRTIEEARNNSMCVPVVPGDYIVGRYVDNAFRSSVNDGVNPFDSLYKYHIKINEELARKRNEFGI